MSTGLRLVLGSARSGTTWLGSMLGRSPTPIRHLMEGMYHFIPRVEVAPHPDHTAAPWVAVLEPDHPVRRFYDIAMSAEFDPVANGIPRHTVRNDADAQYVLIKEVHALLITEALLSAFQAKTCFIHRNPVYSADSLFNRDGIGSRYMINEFRYIQSPDFIDRYFSSQQRELATGFAVIADTSDERLRLILLKVLVIAVINAMLGQIAEKTPNCISIKYEDLCADPMGMLRTVMDFLDLSWGESVTDFVAETSDPSARMGPNSSHYPIFRDSQKNVVRPLSFITESDMVAIRRLIDPINPDWVQSPTFHS